MGAGASSSGGMGPSWRKAASTSLRRLAWSVWRQVKSLSSTRSQPSGRPDCLPFGRYRQKRQRRPAMPSTSGRTAVSPSASQPSSLRRPSSPLLRSPSSIGFHEERGDHQACKSQSDRSYQGRRQPDAEQAGRGNCTVWQPQELA